MNGSSLASLYLTLAPGTNLVMRNSRKNSVSRSGHSNRVGTLNKQRHASTFVANNRNIDFASINAVALENLHALVARWLPDGRKQGREWVALNPRRNDRSPGSFRINLQTGRWADFATDTARGGDPVSLAAYLFGISPSAAARSLAAMFGIGQ